MNDKESYLIKAKESLVSAEADFDKKRYNSCARGSYYACFQAAIFALLQVEIKPKSSLWKHEFVKGQFVLQLINRKKYYSERFRDTLERGSNLRQRADYESRLINQKEASRMLKLAKDFVQHIGNGGKKYE